MGKRIHLVSVGYYLSTNRIGHISAYIVGKIAYTIIARDDETYRNFSAISKRNTYLDQDISLYLSQLVETDDRDVLNFSSELQHIEKGVLSHQETVFIALRHFRYKTDLDRALEEVFPQVLERNLVLCLFQPIGQDPAHYELMEGWKNKFSNISTYYYEENPLALFFFFLKYSKKMKVIAPQYHVIATALLTSVRFFPLVYDNKVAELLKANNVNVYTRIDSITSDDLVKFIKDS